MKYLRLSALICGLFLRSVTQMEDMMKAIMQIGILPAILVYVLVRLEKGMSRLEDAIDKQTNVLFAICARVGNGANLAELIKMKDGGEK
jgi:hypothetical protein